MSTPKILILAEAANPEWVSVPLVGWSLASEIATLTPAHIVTQVRNRDAITRAGLTEGKEFTSIDSEAVASPLFKFSQLLRGKKGVGWTTSTAIAALSYYYFEALVWRRFGKSIANGDYDVVHRITPLSPTIPSLLAAKCRSLGVPFVLGPINGGVPWPKGFDTERRREREWLSYVRSAYKLLPGYKSTLESASALIIGSQDTLKQTPNTYRNKCVYIPENAINPKNFSLTARVSKEGRLRACFVGRLVPYKGPDMLIEALAPLLRDGRIQLDVIGDGPLMPALRTLVSRENLSDGVKLHGWIDHQNLQSIMCQSQIMTFPSVREFGGGVILESMALGIVPVIIDYGGPGELVDDTCGYKIPIGPRKDIVENLRALVLSICEHPGKLSALSAAGRERVHKLFTWNAKAKQVLDIYDWVRGRCPEKPVFFEGPF